MSEEKRGEKNGGIEYVCDATVGPSCVWHDGPMASEVDALIEWAYDIERRLWSRLDDLKDDLRSDEPAVREPAEAEAEELLSWLLPPLTAEQLSESKTERVRRLEEMLRDQGYPECRRRRMAEQLASSSRERGRPRERGRDAIKALSLQLRTDKTLRQIALETSGTCRERACQSYCPACDDVRRSIEPGRPEKLNATRRRCFKCGFPVRPVAQKQQICFKCVDNVRKLAEEARAFLKREGIGVPDELEYPWRKLARILSHVIPGVETLCFF
jgi:hypothetical protein